VQDVLLSPISLQGHVRVCSLDSLESVHFREVGTFPQGNGTAHVLFSTGGEGKARDLFKKEVMYAHNLHGSSRDTTCTCWEALHEPEEAAGEQRTEGEKRARSISKTTGILAQSVTSRESMARTLGLAPAIVVGVVATAPTSPAPAAP